MGKLFHVDRTAALRPGQSLDITSWASIASQAQTIADVALQSHVESLFPDGMTKHGLGYLFWQNIPAFPMQPGLYVDPALATMRSHAIELVAEYIRRAEFPSRPSRYQAVFCWSSLEDAQRFVSEANLAGAVIWEVDGKELFRADMRLLTMGTALATSEAIHQYWRGEKHRTKPPHWELFVAPGATLLSVV
jgi:hypothetical protein